MRSVATALCLSVLVGCAGGGAGGGSSASSGVEGTVVVGPTCPGGETDDPSCQAEPVQATVFFEQEGSAKRSIVSDTDGSFVISLPPGEYSVRATPISPSVRYESRPQQVTVEDGAFATIEVRLDSGIRSPG